MSLSKPLVSIITPSYNRSHFIEGTISSITKQEYCNIEYFVIDGNSTDGTIEILEPYRQKGKLAFLCEDDNGMYDAINKGLTKTHGDILAYLNTDDRYFPWTVEVAVQFFNSHPKVDIIYGDSLVLDLETNTYRLHLLPSYSKNWLRCGGIIPQPTVFFRRRVYEKVRKFQHDVKYLADCEYWLRADQIGLCIQKINEVLAMEIYHTGTIRQKLAKIINDEKELLVSIYSHSTLKSPLIRTLIQRTKYLEKELLTLGFVTGRMLGIKKGWTEFNSNYDIALNIPQYFVDKLFRTKKDVWKLKKR